jgi:hypothetical protein
VPIAPTVTSKMDVTYASNGENNNIEYFDHPENAISAIPAIRTGWAMPYHVVGPEFIAVVNALIPSIMRVLGSNMLYNFQTNEEGAYLYVYHRMTMKLVMTITDSEDVIIRTEEHRIMDFKLHGPHLEECESSVGLDNSMRVNLIFDTSIDEFRQCCETDFESLIKIGISY